MVVQVGESGYAMNCKENQSTAVSPFCIWVRITLRFVGLLYGTKPARCVAVRYGLNRFTAFSNC